MPPEPTFSRSHLSAFRKSLMATTTRPLPHQVAPSSCCHKQLRAARSHSESASPWSASSKDDDEAQSPTSNSASCASSPTPSSPSLPSSLPPSRPPSASAPPQSQLSPVPETGAKKDPDGTISPATIYQHYGCVARRLFKVLSASTNPDRPSAQVQATAPPRALDWPPRPTFGGLGLSALVLDMIGATATTLDELPISANSELPEYQLTQEWFERVLGELGEAEESEAAAAGVGGGEDVEARGRGRETPEAVGLVDE